MSNLTEYLQGQGYWNIVETPLGYIGLSRFIYTVAIVVGLDETGYRHRYCYSTAMEAELALRDWVSSNFVGDPEGYIVRKG